MPSLGADMDAGTLVEWMVAPGDEVKRGDIVAVVETQKGAIEIEIFVEGRIEQLVAEIGDELPVGQPMANICTDQQAAPAAPTEPSPPKPSLTRQGVSAPTLPVSGDADDRIRASPAARRLAEADNIDLASIRVGSGPEGAIIRADIERAGAAASSTSKRETSEFSPMRAAIAAAMSRSKREIPHYYLSHEIDLHAASEWLAKLNAERAPAERLLMGLLFLRASALAAKQATDMNGVWIDEAFQPSEEVHAGLAVSLRGGGLVAPALHNADLLNLDELAEQARELVQRARTGRLRSSEISDPTITVTSLGDRGVDRIIGVVFPPQVAIVGFGTPRVKPAIIDGEFVARMTVTATLAADHRVSDGRSGARFLGRIEQLLQEPEAL